MYVLINSLIFSSGLVRLPLTSKGEHYSFKLLFLLLFSKSQDIQEVKPKVSNILIYFQNSLRNVGFIFMIFLMIFNKPGHIKHKLSIVILIPEFAFFREIC